MPLSVLYRNIETAEFALYARLAPLKKAVASSGAVQQCGNDTRKPPSRAIRVRTLARDYLSYELAPAPPARRSNNRRVRGTDTLL